MTTENLDAAKPKQEARTVVAVAQMALAAFIAGALVLILLAVVVLLDVSFGSGKSSSAGRPKLFCQEDVDCPDGMVCLGYYGSKHEVCVITCADWDHSKDCPEGMQCGIEVDGVQAGDKGVCLFYGYPDKRSVLMAYVRARHAGFMGEGRCDINMGSVRPVVYCQEEHDCPLGMSCLEYRDLPHKTCEFVCSLWHERCPANMECFANRHVSLPYTRGTCEPVTCGETR